MEGQSGSWRRVVLEQPTRNSLGTSGNDLPGLYLLDQTLGVETLMFFDMDEMGWMSIDNLPRFLVYRCGAISRFDRDGTQRLGVGLIANQSTGDVLPAGTVRFSSYLLQRPETRLITEQQAVTRWISALLPLFREKLGWPPCATSWQQFAAGTVANLVEDTTSQVTVNGHTGLRAYSKASSQIWTQPDNNFELMTLADVLWPSLLYLRLHPSAAFEAECNRLAASLPGFYHPDTHSISNDYIRPPHERADSWYPFENALVKYPMIAGLTGSKELVANFLDAFAGARRLADRYNYLFPIYYQTATFAGGRCRIELRHWRPVRLGCAILAGPSHSATPISTAKKLAAPSSVLADRSRRPAFFTSRRNSASRALAAAELGLQADDSPLPSLRKQMRMFYWYSDPSQKTHQHPGYGAGSRLHPVSGRSRRMSKPSCHGPASSKRGLLHPYSLLRFMDQQRRNNFSFFESVFRGPHAT